MAPQMVRSSCSSLLLDKLFSGKRMLATVCAERMSLPRQSWASETAYCRGRQDAAERLAKGGFVHVRSLIQCLARPKRSSYIRRNSAGAGEAVACCGNPSEQGLPRERLVKGPGSLLSGEKN